ncbi:MAG: hypothetical protein JWN56_2530 [Sphingobacteriales bacterium]|nr:hypothetical protein [Sphingobacteriales bacterium]
MKKILILDDDPDLLEVLKEALETSGYEILTKSSSSDLFRVIDEFKPDLLLLDFLLMNENGGEICAQLKRNGNTKHLPIILLSGYCSIQEMHVIYGCDSYLAKPFDLQKLLNNIENLIIRDTVLQQIA